MNLKNIFKILLFVFVNNAHLLAQDFWSEIFSVLEQKDYDKAQKLLDNERLNKGYGFYALQGALNEKNKEYPQALLAYRRAQSEVEISTFFDSVAQIKKVQKVLGNEENDFYEYSTTLFFLIWPIFFQILLLLGLACLMIWLKNKFHPSYLLFVGLLLFFLGLSGWYISVWLKKRENAVLLKQTEMYIGPDESYQKFKNLNPGQEVIITNALSGSNWYKIYADGVSGWIVSDNVEKVRNDHQDSTTN